jgi:kynurenine formamidase
MEMPVYPGTESPRIVATNTVEKHGFKEHLVTMVTHTGTHIDAPSHMMLDGKNLDDMDISSFHGKALLIDCQDCVGGRIGVEKIRQYETQLKTVDFVIFNTGWSKKWNTDAYFSDFPTPSVEAAQYLVNFNLKGIGVDAISIDPIVPIDFSVHHIILGKGMISIENLTALDELSTEIFTLSVFPLKLKEADGSAVRAVAQV